MSVTVIGAAASAWGLVMALAPILQIIRMVRRRSSRDVSLGYFAVLLPGFGLWLVYGLVGADLFLVLPNALAIVTGSLLIAVAFALRRAESGSPDDLTVADPTSR